jgi:hypothetical protein
MNHVHAFALATSVLLTIGIAGCDDSNEDAPAVPPTESASPSTSDEEYLDGRRDEAGDLIDQMEQDKNRSPLDGPEPQPTTRDDQDLRRGLLGGE